MRSPAKTAHGMRAATLAGAAVACLACACGTYGRILWDDPPDADVGLPDGLAAIDGGFPRQDATFDAIAILDGSSPTASQGGPNGDAFADLCPANQAIVG